MSQLSATGAASVTVLSTGNPLPTPAALDLPVPGAVTDDLAAATAEINAYFEPVRGDAGHVPRHPVSERVLRAGAVRAGDPQRGRPAAHVHGDTTSRRRPGSSPTRSTSPGGASSSMTPTTARTARSPAPNTRLLPPGPGPQHDQRVPRRGHDHEPHRRPPLVVRRRPQPGRVADPPRDRGVRVRVHARERASGRPRCRRPPDRRQLQRPQLLPVHRHRGHLCARRRTRTAAVQTARSSSSASARRCWLP